MNKLEEKQRIHDLVMLYIREASKSIKKCDYRKALMNLDKFYIQNCQILPLEEMDQISIYFRINYSINKILLQYLLIDRENSQPKKKQSLLVRKQIFYFNQWYNLMDSQIYKNFEEDEDTLCPFRKSFLPKILFRFLEEIQKFLYIMSFLQLKKNNLMQCVFHFYGKVIAIEKVFYLYFDELQQIISMEQVKLSLAISRFYWEMKNHIMAIKQFQQAFNATQMKIEKILRYRTLSIENEEMLIHPLTKNVLLYNLLKFQFNFLVHVLICLANVYEEEEQIQRHRDCLFLAKWISVYGFNQEFEEQCEFAKQLFTNSKQKYTKYLADIGDFQKIFKLLYSDDDNLISKNQTQIQDNSEYRKFNDLYYVKYEHETLNKVQMLRFSPQVQAHHTEYSAQSPDTKAVQIKVQNQIIQSSRSSLRKLVGRKKDEENLFSYIMKKDIQSENPSLIQGNISAIQEKNLHSSNDLSFESTQIIQESNSLQKENFDIYGFNNENLEYYISKRVAKKLQEDSSFYSYDAIVDKSSREISQHKIDQQNHANIKTLIQIKKKYSNGRIPRIGDKKPFVCKIGVHMKIEHESEHFTAYLRATDQIQQMKKQKEEEEKQKLSEQFFMNIAGESLGEETKTNKEIVQHKFSKVIGIKSLKALQQNLEKEKDKKNIFLRPKVEQDLGNGKEKTQIIEAHAVSNQLLKELMGNYEKDIFNATMRQKNPRIMKKVPRVVNQSKERHSNVLTQENLFLKNNVELGESTIKSHQTIASKKSINVIDVAVSRIPKIQMKKKKE